MTIKKGSQIRQRLKWEGDITLVDSVIFTYNSSRLIRRYPDDVWWDTTTQEFVVDLTQLETSKLLRGANILEAQFMFDGAGTDYSEQVVFAVKDPLRTEYREIEGFRQELDPITLEVVNQIVVVKGEGGTDDHTKLKNREVAAQHPIGAINGLEEKLDTIPTELAQLTDDATHRLVTDEEKAKWNKGGGGGTKDHNELINRDMDNQHPMSAIAELLPFTAYVDRTFGEINSFTGVVEQLDTRSKQLAPAITEVLWNVGDLATLTTVTKESAVDAINELKDEMVTDHSHLSGRTDADQHPIRAIGGLSEKLDQIDADVTQICTNIGVVSELATDAKVIVPAINEVLGKISGLEEMYAEDLDNLPAIGFYWTDANTKGKQPGWSLENHILYLEDAEGRGLQHSWNARDAVKPSQYRVKIGASWGVWATLNNTGAVQDLDTRYKKDLVGAINEVLEKITPLETRVERAFAPSAYQKVAFYPTSEMTLEYFKEPKEHIVPFDSGAIMFAKEIDMDITFHPTTSHQIGLVFKPKGGVSVKAIDITAVLYGVSGGLRTEISRNEGKVQSLEESYILAINQLNVCINEPFVLPKGSTLGLLIEVSNSQVNLGDIDMIVGGERGSWFVFNETLRLGTSSIMGLSHKGGIVGQNFINQDIYTDIDKANKRIAELEESVGGPSKISFDKPDYRPETKTWTRAWGGERLWTMQGTKFSWDGHKGIINYKGKADLFLATYGEGFKHQDTIVEQKIFRKARWGEAQDVLLSHEYYPIDNEKLTIFYQTVVHNTDVQPMDEFYLEFTSETYSGEVSLPTEFGQTHYLSTQKMPTPTPPKHRIETSRWKDDDGHRGTWYMELGADKISYVLGDTFAQGGQHKSIIVKKYCKGHLKIKFTGEQFKFRQDVLHTKVFRRRVGDDDTVVGEWVGNPDDVFATKVEIDIPNMDLQVGDNFYLEFSVTEYDSSVNYCVEINYFTADLVEM